MTIDERIKACAQEITAGRNHAGHDAETAIRSLVKHIISDFVTICGIEAAYWAGATDERIQEASAGAMGAASNILAAIITEQTPDEYVTKLKEREKTSDHRTV